MDKLFFDKKGGEKIMSVWWFAVLIVVGTGIVIAVLMFYSAEEDTRYVESEILYNKIADCVVQDGFLVDGVLAKEFDLMKICSLNEKTINEDKLFYIKINVLDENGNSLREQIVEGNKEFVAECEIQKPDENGKEIGAKYYSKCFEKTINIIYSDGKKGKLEILTASDNVGRKIGATENA